MLANLLQSFAVMKLPADVAVEFAIVENNDALTLAQIIEDNLPGKVVHYELEPTLGISSLARSVPLRQFNNNTVLVREQRYFEHYSKKKVKESPRIDDRSEGSRAVILRLIQGCARKLLQPQQLLQEAKEFVIRGIQSADQDGDGLISLEELPKLLEMAQSERATEL